MPNRILKETICTSETINHLSEAEEVFFYRLLVNCDDFGRMDARPQVLRARLYPLRTETIKEHEITARLLHLQEIGLIQLYEVEGHPYLQVITWEKHQQRRAKHSKYPSPDEGTCNHVISDDEHMKSDDSVCPRESRNENTRNENRSISSETDVSTPKKETPKFDEVSAPYRLALYLRYAILTRDPGTKVPANLQKWAVEADRLLRIDKRDPEEAAALITWCQQHHFWSANILSMDKFRKQYDVLKRQHDQQQKQTSRASPPTDRSSLRKRFDENDLALLEAHDKGG